MKGFCGGRLIFPTLQGAVVNFGYTNPARPGRVLRAHEYCSRLCLRAGLFASLLQCFSGC